MRQALFFCTCLLALALTAVPAFAATPPLPEQVRNLAQHAQEGIAAADANKPELVRAEYEELHAIWGGFEDQVRAADPQGYLDLEAALDQIKDTVAAQPLDLAAVKAAYAQFNNAANQVADRLGATPAAAPSAALIDATDVTPTTLLDTLGEVEGALVV